MNLKHLPTGRRHFVQRCLLTHVWFFFAAYQSSHLFI